MASMAHSASKRRRKLSTTQWLGSAMAFRNLAMSNSSLSSYRDMSASSTATSLGSVPAPNPLQITCVGGTLDGGVSAHRPVYQLYPPCGVTVAPSLDAYAGAEATD